MKNIWITGAEGHVGSALMKLLDCTKYRILGTDINEVDITHVDEVHAFMRRNRPDVVVNCAGLSDVATCAANPDEAYRVNALGARNLAAEVGMMNCKLIQISTDDVFDQTSLHPYNEFDTVHPVTVYGKSKWAGEQLVTELCKRHAIIRSSWVYGTGKDFINHVLEALETTKTLSVPCNQWASPTSAKELAKVIATFIDEDRFGRYHVVCTGYCNRYEYAREILKILGKTDELTLVPVDETTGVHSTYSVLDNMMLRLEGLPEPADWKTALKEYLTETGGKE